MSVSLSSSPNPEVSSPQAIRLRSLVILGCKSQRGTSGPTWLAALTNSCDVASSAPISREKGPPSWSKCEKGRSTQLRQKLCSVPKNTRDVRRTSSACNRDLNSSAASLLNVIQARPRVTGIFSESRYAAFVTRVAVLPEPGPVLVQPEMEKRRSPLVSYSALRAGIFKA